MSQTLSSKDNHNWDTDTPPLRPDNASVVAHKDANDQNDALPELEAQKTEAQQASAPEANEDPNLVTWTGPDDPENPHNWRTGYKVFITGIWVFGNIVTTVASSIFSSGASLIEREFDVSPTVATLGVSLFLVVCSATCQVFLLTLLVLSMSTINR